MDESCEQTTETLELVQDEPAPRIIDTSDVLQPAGLRRSLRICDEVDRIFLDNRSRFLFRVCPIFWLVLLGNQK
jgi:hypothetical protein